MDKNLLNSLSQEIIGASIEVHSIIGPGMLENIYSKALAYELRLRGHKVEMEVPIPCIYKGVAMNTAYRADLIVDDAIIVELKATENDSPLYSKQLFSYLRLADKKLGLLINFNRKRLIDGLTRVVNNI